MAIKIKSLEVDKLSKESLKNGFLYKDLFLDISPQYSYNKQLHKKEYVKDIQALFDIKSVKNSIKNAFLTSPGEKLLNPTYGIDLRRFLFQPITVFTTDIIRSEISSKLPIMEPRVTVSNIQVNGIPDENKIDIEFQIDVPSLNVYGLQLKSQLSNTGYVIL